MVTPRPNPNDEPSSGGNVVVSQTMGDNSNTVSSVSTTSSGPIMTPHSLETPRPIMARTAEQYVPSFTSPMRRTYGMSEFTANLHNSSSTLGSSSAFGENLSLPFQTYQGLGPLSRPPGFVLPSQAIPTFTSSSVAVMRQQMDESNHEMVHMLTQQMGTILRPLIQDSTQSYQQLATQMTRT